MKNKKPRFKYYINTYLPNIVAFRKALTDLSEIMNNENNPPHVRARTASNYFDMVPLLDTVKRVKRGR